MFEVGDATGIADGVSFFSREQDNLHDLDLDSDTDGEELHERAGAAEAVL